MTDRSTVFDDALDEVHTRFILNLPDSELQRADRILFQLEQAWWFYEDFLVDNHNKNPENVPLPSFNLKQFAQQLFEYSPLLDPQQFTAMWNEFTKYKKMIGTYGCILLSTDCKKVVLVQLWNSNTHTFPSGKINQGEEEAAAAARETFEETGFDVYCRQGVTAEWKETNPEKITWTTRLNDSNALSFQEESGKRRTCFVVHGVPTDFPFQAMARKEVSGISWHPIDNLPKPSFAVAPFLSQLKRWIKDNRRSGSSRKSSSSNNRSTPNRRDQSNPKDRRSSSRRKDTPGKNRSNSQGRVVRAQDDLVACGLASEGDVSGWSEEEMFATNEKLIGRKITYDGNPHIFSEGFGGQDPHSFHVVGGSFLNSQGIVKLAPAPETSKLQPLFRVNSEVDDKELTPFFSMEGVPPWGELVEDACGFDGSPSNIPSKDKLQKRDSGEELLKLLQSSSRPVVDAEDSIFLTDAQITARSQADKTARQTIKRSQIEAQYEADMQYIRDWVASLPPPQPTKLFGEFRLDADAIMTKLNPIFERRVDSE